MRVHSEVHVVVVVAVKHALDDTRGPMQRPKPRSDQVVARLAPYRIASGVRTDRSRGNGPLSRRCALDDRLEQTRWCARAPQLGNGAQVQTELVVPDRVPARGMFPAEPPEPAAAPG